MTDSLNQRLIDAMAEKLQVLGSLPDDFNLVKYRRPKAINPQDCPMMVIWVRQKTPTPRSTVFFDGSIVIGISWHEESVAEAETLINDDDKSMILLNAMEVIEAETRNWSRDGLGVSEAWQILPGTTTYLEPNHESGLTEGYSFDVIVSVTEA